MGNIGFQELILLLVIFVLPVTALVVFIYKYGKLKGRVKELERQLEQR